MDPETNSFRQLVTVARERSTSGWITLVPLAKRQGNRRLFNGGRPGGVTHFDTGETGWRIGLCPDRGFDATSIASPGFLSDFLAHFVGAGQITPELNFVPGMINDSANMCITYKGGLMSWENADSSTASAGRSRWRWRRGGQDAHSVWQPTPLLLPVRFTDALIIVEWKSNRDVSRESARLDRNESFV